MLRARTFIYSSGSIVSSVRRKQKVDLTELQRFAEIGRLSASLLHEISNPLTAALLHLELHEHADHPNIRHARRNMVLLRKYVEAARQQVRRESPATNFRLRPHINQVKAIVRPLAKLAGVQLDIKPVPACTLYGDPVKLQQVVSNLIINAVDAYRNDSSQSLARPVLVDFSINRQQLIIHVTDWGEGINREQLQRIFDPFYSTKQQPGKGLGIGLAMVKWYIYEDFKGSIKVQSSRRQGTQFTVKLPLSVS